MFLLQFIFFIGVNSNESHIICKLVSIVQHYLSITTYAWIFIINLHLYRMLTELRDINKIGSRLPVFYYVIGYIAPIIIVSLTLAIKQDIYTNYDLTLSFINYPVNKLDLSSVYCWLNINNFNDILYILIFPIGIFVFLFLILGILSYKEIKKTTFKQTDVKLVFQSLLSSLVLLLVNFCMTLFLLLFLNASNSQSSVNESNIYQHLFLFFSLTYSILTFLIFIALNKANKAQLYKISTFIWFKFSRYSKKTVFIDENNLDISKTKMNNAKFAFVNPYPSLKKQEIEVVNVNKINSKFMFDYPNSICTTTTSGTLENTDEFDYLKPSYPFIQQANGYLINTTNTDTTTNESDFNYNYDFTKPPVNNTESIQECDVVDVAQVLKTKSFAFQDLQSQSNNQLINQQTGKYNQIQTNQNYKRETKYFNSSGKVF